MKYKLNLNVIGVVAVLAVAFIGCDGKDAKPYTTFTDTRDGKVYKTIEIGGQTWFAENLNYAAEGSKCYENKNANCAKYGRLYDWTTAMNACPAGFHLSSDEEWTTLVNYAGGAEKAGTKLKSSKDWKSFKGVNGVPAGTDDYGFSALPGGIRLVFEDIDFGGAGIWGFWWSTGSDDDNASNREMFYKSEEVEWGFNDKTKLYSVRCVEDGSGSAQNAAPTQQDNTGSAQTTSASVSDPDFPKDGAVTGARSRASIQGVVMRNKAALRYAYNRRVRDKPGLAGTITVKFTIDEYGKVIFAQVVESTMDDSELENTVVTRIKGWVFEKIDKSGDVTEVVYPLVFSRE